MLSANAVTRSPFLKDLTAEPISMTVPAMSTPRIYGTSIFFEAVACLRPYIGPTGNQSTSVLYFVINRVYGDGMVADENFVSLGGRKRYIPDNQR